MKIKTEDLASYLAILAYFLLGAATLFGIFHSYSKHSTKDFILSIAIPPYAWYRAADGIFWHDDYKNINWDSRLKNDIRSIQTFLDASSDIEETKINAFGIAVEEFSAQINKYPEDKQLILKDFSETYISYIESYIKDFNSELRLFNTCNHLIINSL